MLERAGGKAWVLQLKEDYLAVAALDLTGLACEHHAYHGRTKDPFLEQHEAVRRGLQTLPWSAAGTSAAVFALPVAGGEDGTPTMRKRQKK